jgi:hypothetical protein
MNYQVLTDDDVRRVMPMSAAVDPTFRMPQINLRNFCIRKLAL